MSQQPLFIAPDPEELTEAGAIEAPQDEAVVARDARDQRDLLSLLGRRAFDALEPGDHDTLWDIATSTSAARPTLHPNAALAALALWRHGAPGYASRAGELLRERSLPDEPRWLEELVGALDKSESARGALALGRLELEAGFWAPAALIGGLALTRRHSRWRAGAAGPHLLRACDRAATQFPRRERPWLDLIADATVGGDLDYPWAERVVAACIRLSVDDPARQARLRAFHARRPYEADHPRVAELVAPRLLVDERPAREVLLEEADRLAPLNPTRALTLTELAMLSRRDLTSRRATRDRARAQLRKLDAPDLEGARAGALASLYVHTFDVDPRAAGFVRQWHDRLDLDVDPEELDVYLMISDYERAFRHLTCKYDGVSMSQADKHSATRVKYFIEKRLAPGSVTRMIEAVFSPLEWMGASVAGVGLLERAAGQGLRAFEARSRKHELGPIVVDDLRACGAELERFEDVANLSLGSIEAALARRRASRLLLGALAGGLSGGLAPVSWGVVTITDVPVLLALCADICSRFCWYYGFDPREHADLPLEILAVALGGSRPDAVQPMLLRQNLQEFMVRKSLVLGALAQGTVRAVVGKAAGQFLEARLGARVTERARQLASRAVSRNLQQRAARSAPTRALPLVSALLGASLNAALIYDICEAAQAVLTDRFLERKYPDWIRQFDLAERGEA